jgi:amino acid adenylation domain-containing protein
MTKKDNKNILAYPTSYAQKRIWFLEKIEQGRIKNNIGIVSSFEGVFPINELKRMLQFLVERHEELRANFHETESGEVVQVINEVREIQLNIFDLRGEDEGNKQRRKDKIIKEETEHKFDLAQDILIRFSLIILADDKQVFIACGHHMVVDAWSMSVVINEFFYLAQSHFYKQKINLPEISVQYKDYVAWEQSQEFQERIAESGKYWREKLSGDLPVLELPTDYKRPISQKYETGTETIVIDKEKTKILHELCRIYDTTPFVLSAALVNIILYRLTGQEDLILGTYIVKRDLPELDNVVGPLLNSLPLRTKINSEMDFRNFLSKFNQEFLSAMEHKDYPFEELISEISPERDITRSPIFNVVFQAFNTAGIRDLKKNIFFDWTQEYSTFDKTLGQFDLSFHLHNRDDDFLLALTYNYELFSKQTIKKYLSYFLVLLEEVYQNKGSKISDLNIFSQEDKDFLLDKFNDTNYNLDKTKDVFDIFWEQAEKTPDNIALNFLNKEYTYKKVFEEICFLAPYLQKRGLKAGMRIGLALERGPDFLFTFLSLLALGVSIVPLNQKDPKKRLEFMSKDSNLEFIICEDKEDFAWFNNTIIFSQIDKVGLVDKFQKKTNYFEEEAFIMYTSGSTGKPKGVILNQKSIINNALFNIDFLKFSERTVMAQNYSSIFVASIWQFLAPLFVGGKVVIYPDNISRDIPKLINKIAQDKITIWETNASILSLLLEMKLPVDKFSPDLQIIVTGEDTPDYLVEKFYDLYSFSLINAYGQTEGTGDTLKYRIPSQGEKKVLLGEPIFNTKVYVLDKDMNLTPVNSIGEIYISGDCLADGYLNLQQKNKEKFLPHPFISGEKIYRSGDLGRRLVNGQIEYMGRVDDQINIRGRRIELNEIVNVLSGRKEIKLSLAQKYNDEIVVYYTVIEDVRPLELRAYLSGFLPEFMLPTYFIKLDFFPLNENAKIDKNALPKPQDKYIPHTEGEEPCNDLEKMLADLWKKILPVKKVNRSDDFFALGGHSFLALKLLNDLNGLGYNIALQDIFRFSALDELALYCEKVLEKQKKSGGIPFTAFGDLIKKYKFIPAALPDKLEIDINIFDQDKFVKSLEKVKQKNPNYSFSIKSDFLNLSLGLRDNDSVIVFKINNFQDKKFLQILVNYEKINKEELVGILWDFQKFYNLNLAEINSEEVYTPFFSYPDYYHCLHANFLEKVYFEKQQNFYASLSPAYDYFLVPSYVILDESSRATSDFNAIYLGEKDLFVSARKLGLQVEHYQAKDRNEAEKHFKYLAYNNLLLLLGNNYFLPSSAYYKNENFIAALEERRNILPMNLSLFQIVNNKIIVSSPNLKYFGEIKEEDFWEYWKNFRDFEAVDFVSNFNSSFQAFNLKELDKIKFQNIEMLYEALEMNAKEFFQNKEFETKKDLGFEKIIFGQQVFAKFKEDIELNIEGEEISDIVILDMLKRLSRPQLFLHDLLSDIVALDDDFALILNKVAYIINLHDELFDRLYNKIKDNKPRYEPNLSFLPPLELRQQEFLSTRDKEDMLELTERLYSDLSVIYQEILEKLKIINK